MSEANKEDGPTSTSKALEFLTPASFIRAARAAHPAFRFALLVAGLFAIIFAFIKFGVDPATLVFGAIAIIVLMVVFAVFAQAIRLRHARLTLPAMVLVWSFLVLTIASALGLTSSAFLNWPLPFREWIVRELDLPQQYQSVNNLETTVKELLSSKSLPVPGESYLADTLMQQYGLHESPHPTNFSYNILSGTFSTFENQSIGAAGKSHRLVAMKGSKVVGVQNKQFCPQPICDRIYADWRVLAEDQFGRVTDETFETGIDFSPGASKQDATRTTIYSKTWNVELLKITPKAGNAGYSTIAIVVAEIE